MRNDPAGDAVRLRAAPAFGPVGQYPDQPRHQRRENHRVRRLPEASQPARAGHGRSVQASADPARWEDRRADLQRRLPEHVYHGDRSDRQARGAGSVSRERRDPDRHYTDGRYPLLPCELGQDTARARLQAEAHGGRRCERSVRRLQGGQASEQHGRHLLLQRPAPEIPQGRMTGRPIAIVTGGAGFIGSHMVDVLVERGFSVRAIDNLAGGREENLAPHRNNPDLVLEKRDIRSCSPDDRLFRDARYVFHFAGIGDIVPSIERPLEYMSANVQGTAHMLECARNARVEKFVYAASSSCYGLASVPTREDHPIEPRYPYALSKYLGEQAALHWHRVYMLPVNSIRIFNAYGTRSRTSGAYGAVFGVFLAQKLAGKPFTVVGDGTQRRDFVYVTDVARAFYLAATTDRVNGIYNVGAGNPQSVNRLVELLGGDVLRLPRRPGEPECTWADISKITSELGWEPRVSFEQGVGMMLKNIEYWRQAPVWDRESIEQATKTWFQFLEGKT